MTGGWGSPSPATITSLSSPDGIEERRLEQAQAAQKAGRETSSRRGRAPAQQYLRDPRTCRRDFRFIALPVPAPAAATRLFDEDLVRSGLGVLERKSGAYESTSGTPSPPPPPPPPPQRN